MFEQNDRRTGSYYEEIAAQYLEENGIPVIARNYRIRIGEIDIIAEDSGYLCFTEVKYRRSGSYGRPAEAVTVSKQRTIRRVAEYWISEHKAYHRPVRFDVIEITGHEIRHLKNAF